MTTLTQLARQLGITQHGAFCAAGMLLQRAPYRWVISDPTTGELTEQAERAIRNYVAARVNTVVPDLPDEPLTPTYAGPNGLSIGRRTAGDSEDRAVSVNSPYG